VRGWEYEHQINIGVVGRQLDAETNFVLKKKHYFFFNNNNFLKRMHFLKIINYSSLMFPTWPKTMVCNINRAVMQSGWRSGQSSVHVDGLKWAMKEDDIQVVHDLWILIHKWTDGLSTNMWSSEFWPNGSILGESPVKAMHGEWEHPLWGLFVAILSPKNVRLNSQRS
jgi:hypothetical protein